MTTTRLLALCAACLLAPVALAGDQGVKAADKEATTGSHIKRLPNISAHDTVAYKTPLNADNTDLDPLLQEILREAEQAEQQ